MRERPGSLLCPVPDGPRLTLRVCILIKSTGRYGPRLTFTVLHFGSINKPLGAMVAFHHDFSQWDPLRFARFRKIRCQVRLPGNR